MSTSYSEDREPQSPEVQMQDIADLPAVEVIGRYAVDLLTVAAVQCGLAEDGRKGDLDEARKLINATAGFITAAAADLGDHHARPLRDALRQVQFAGGSREIAMARRGLEGQQLGHGRSELAQEHS